MLRFVVLVLLLGVACGKHEIYDGYTVFEITVHNEDQAKLVNLMEAQLNLDVWTQSLPEVPGYVLVPGELKNLVENELNSKGIAYRIEVENVREQLEQEDKILALARNKPNRATQEGGLPIDTIYTYNEIMAYLDSLAEAFPDLVKVATAGQSLEGRDIKYLKISTTNFEDPNKPIIYIQSLLHAREWVGQPVTLTVIKKLIFDVTDADAIEDFDWIVLPVANPDGYYKTHSRDRYWRKNTGKGYIIGDICSGVDLNRNFDINWAQASSSSVCAEDFHGKSPTSEPETQAIQKVLQENLDRLEMFLDIHSFGSYILYGYGNKTLPSNALMVNYVGVEMAKAVDAVKMSWNKNYTVGNLALVLYAASGGSQDYAQSIGIPYSYTYELPGRRYAGNSLQGFLVADSFIEQAGFETWQGILTGIRLVRNNFRMRRGIH